MEKKQNYVTWTQTVWTHGHIKTEEICKDNAKNVETRFDTSNYELDRSLPREKNKKVTGLMKDELGRKRMTH